MPNTKPKNITAFFIVFIVLSFIFVVLAYGYGQTNQAIKDNTYWVKNINRSCENNGYVKTESIIKQDTNGLSIPLVNSTLLNNTLLNNILNLTP